MSATMPDEQAIDWAVRVGEPDFDDWEGFTAWLEADAAHAAAYEVVLAAGEAGEHALPARALAAAAPARRRRAWAGGAIAAAIAGVVAWTALPAGPEPYLIETAPGARRQVELAGATILVNGGTRLWLDRRDQHVATLERGEALFEMHRGDGPAFVVHAGDAELRDVGTRFDVVRENDATRVAVAEGAVLYDPDGDAIRVGAGHELRVRAGAAAAELRPADPRAVGSWRAGRFAYVGASIATIAADLSRSTGIAIAATAPVATTSFTGTIAYAGDRDAFLAELGPLLGVRVVARRGGWALDRARTSP